MVLLWFSGGPNSGSPVVQYGGSPVVLPWFSGGSPMLTLFRDVRSLKHGYVVYATRIYGYVWYWGYQITFSKEAYNPQCSKIG